MKTMEERLNRFRVKLKEKGMDGALISKRENYIYLSGFTGTSATLIITLTEAVLVTDFRYEEQAAAQAKEFQVVKFQGSLLAALNDQLKARGVKRLGFEDATVTFKEYTDYKSKLEVDELLPTDGMEESLRIRKSSEEIEIISKAVEIADKAFSHITGVIRPGVSESEIAAELEYQMKKLGAKGPSFETIVASGERSSMPHGVASEKKIAMGDTVTLDFGAIYQDYCSDMTRTVFVGNPKEEIRRIYGIVLEAQRKAEEGARAGLHGKEIDLIARNHISAAGFEKCFGHGLGHGVGLEIHEEPRLSPSGAYTMENGMVVTVEPGIYVPGLGGVRIEDMLVIRDGQPLILTKSTKELVVI